MAQVTGAYAGVQAVQTDNTAPWVLPERLIDGSLLLASVSTCVLGTTDRQRLGNAGLGVNWTPWLTVTSVSITITGSAVLGA